MSRDKIFKAIVSAHDRATDGLGLKPTTPQQRRDAAKSRLSERPRNLQPARSRLDRDALPDLFKSEAERQLATVIEVATPDEIPSAVSNYLKSANAPQTLRMGNDPALTEIPWTQSPQLTIDKGPAQATDAVGLSRAIAGIAETGTLTLCSGPDNPVTLNYMPDTHVVVLNRSDIVATYEDAFDQVRARGGSNQEMPRTLNLITGPSRTADIGGKIVIGAHGARRLAVILVG